MAKSEGARKRRTRRVAGGGKAARADRQGRNGVVEWAKSIVIILVVFFGLRTFVVQTFVITSGSMENTLLVGDFVVVNRAAIGSTIPFTHIRIPGYSSPERGDVLVFTPPPSDPGVDMDLVKRLIGMPGDTIQMKNRVVYIDGKPLSEPYVRQTDAPDISDPRMDWQKAYLEPGVNPKTYSPTRDDWGPLIIPKDRYFMMGDNRENSLDSRYWGFVTGQSFQGRAEFLYFSYNRGSYRPFPWLLQIRWGRIGRIIH